MSQIFAPSVYRWCRERGLQANDAADVVQEVFLSVSKNIDRFRRDRPGDSFRGWLWTIFRSKLMDHFRQRKAQFPHDLPEQIEELPQLDPSSDGVSPDNEAAQMVRRALAIIEKDFSVNTWQAFWRSAILSERTSEIAIALKMSPAAVCMCRARVLVRLRETLDGLGILKPAQQLLSN